MTPNHLKDAYLRSNSNDREDLYVVTGKLVTDCLEVFGLTSKQPQYREWEALRREVSGGLYWIDRKGVRTVAELLRAEADRDECIATAQGVGQLVIDEAKKSKTSISAAYRKLKDKGAVTESRATIYRRVGAVRSGRAIHHHEAKGNRNRRHSDEIVTMIQAEAELLYLVPKSSYTLTNFVEHVSERAKQIKYLPADKKFSRDFVWKTILEVDPDPEAARMDPKEAVAGKSVARHTIRVSGPLERVEQDALHLPFVVQTPWGISRDVWLVHAIDCFLSYPVGWVLVVGSVSASDALSCLERVLFSKTQLFEQLGVPGTYDLFGTPSRVIFDNGPENKGSRLPRVVRLGIDTLHCRSHGAHGKPYIERLNRSLKEYLQTLPGCTRFDGKDGARDPEAEGDDLPTLAQLERDIVGFFYKHWIHKPLDRLTSMIFVDEFRGNTPAQVARQYIEVEENALPMPPNVDEWRAVRYERARCKLSRKTGITLTPFEYRGAGLERLIRLVGEIVVDVLWVPEDFRYVWVPIDHGHKREQVRLENKDIGPNTPAYTFSQAKQMLDRAASMENPGEAVNQAFRGEIRSRASAGSAARPKNAKSKKAVSAATTAAAREHAALERSMRPAEPPPTGRQNAADNQAEFWPSDVQPAQVVRGDSAFRR